MEITIPLEKMNVADKIHALEYIWDDLCHIQDAVPSPSWHAEILQEREQKIRDGKAKFYDLDEAKRIVWGKVE